MDVGIPTVAASTVWSLNGTAALVATRLGTTLRYILQQHSMWHMAQVPGSAYYCLQPHTLFCCCRAVSGRSLTTSSMLLRVCEDIDEDDIRVGQQTSSRGRTGLQARAAIWCMTSSLSIPLLAAYLCVGQAARARKCARRCIMPNKAVKITRKQGT